jgi:hypothetical protein
MVGWKKEEERVRESGMVRREEEPLLTQGSGRVRGSGDKEEDRKNDVKKIKIQKGKKAGNLRSKRVIDPCN